MTKNESTATAEPAQAEPGVSRRELAVARSLDSARVRAEHRLQRFVDAALELIRAVSYTHLTLPTIYSV